MNYKRLFSDAHSDLDLTKQTSSATGLGWFPDAEEQLLPELPESPEPSVAELEFLAVANS